jgi:hypothetical protein
VFDYFNIPFIEDAISKGKTVYFSHDPRKYDGYLEKEWEYLQSRGYKDVIEKGDGWIAH